jgi:hypothetical protein
MPWPSVCAPSATEISNAIRFSAFPRGIDTQRETTMNEQAVDAQTESTEINAEVLVGLGINGLRVTVSNPNVRFQGGSANTIIWRIDPMYAITFPQQFGVVFVPTPEQPNVWPPDNQPVYVDGTYRVTYANPLEPGELSQSYNYMLSVVMPDQSLRMNPDPDVTNDPPG